MSGNSRLVTGNFRSKLKAMHSLGREFCESSCARKETVDTDILVTSRNGDKKNHAIYQNNE